MDKIMKKLLCAFLFSGAALTTYASDISFTDVPLAVKTQGVSPNIMILIDRSGSMIQAQVQEDALDVFYAPGFDSNKEYRCVTEGREILNAIPTETLRVFISSDGSTKGVPYFSYNGKYYVWGDNAVNKIGTHEINGKNVCFNPEEKYKVLLKSNTEKKSCLTYEYRYADNHSWITDASGTCPNDAPQCQCKVNYNYLEASGFTAEVLDGNFLNWYFSATESKFSNFDLDGGFRTDYPEHGFWTEEHAKDFWVDGQNRGANQFTGYKRGVSDTHERLAVALDVSKKQVRDIYGAYFSIAGFRDNSDVSLQSPFYEIAPKPVDRANPTAAELLVLDQINANKKHLLSTIVATPAGGGTPTAQALAVAMGYFFTDWISDTFKFKKTINGAEELVTLSTVSNSGTFSGAPAGKNITESKWCQKNAIAVLTDGEPSTGSINSKFSDYVPYGVLSSDITGISGSDSDKKKDLVRMAGLLYDQDFLKGVQGKQNIEVFMIAFGDNNTFTSKAFIAAGRAGGGGVDNFYPAKDGAAVNQAFKDIIARVQSDSASVTAVAVSTVSEEKINATHAVQATYETEFWSSSLKAFKLNEDGEFVNPDGSGASKNSAGITPIWEANDVMNKMYLVDQSNNIYRQGGVLNRLVYTWNGSEGVQFGGSNLTVNNVNDAYARLPEMMQADLNRRSGTDAQNRYDLMLFLLGDITNEVGYPAKTASGKFKRRGVYLGTHVTGNDQKANINSVLKGGMLGDITNSSPVYVKEPSRQWDDKYYGSAEQRYSVFKEQNKDRAAVIYAGTNRGFLHAFALEQGNRNTVAHPAGAELFAYMPSMLASVSANEGYSYLASNRYEHKFYVDLPVTNSDVFMDFYSSDTAVKNPEWRSIIVGGLRSGGKGLFALDVTCPYKTNNTESTCDDEQFNAQNVLWEFDDKAGTGDPDLGFTFAEPLIAKVNYNAGYQGDNERNGNGRGRWAVIVSNGYNSLNGKAALYILFLDGGLDGIWTEGKDYLKIRVGDSTDTATNKNGLSAPVAVDVNNDGVVDRVYAGDLKGQMWVFDISQAVAYRGGN